MRTPLVDDDSCLVEKRLSLRRCNDYFEVSKPVMNIARVTSRSSPNTASATTSPAHQAINVTERCSNHLFSSGRLIMLEHFMRLKLAFSHSSLSLFRVSAVSLDDYSSETAITVFDDGDTFLKLLSETRIAAEERRLIATAVNASIDRHSVICSAEADLAPEDIRLLRLRAILSRSA